MFACDQDEDLNLGKISDAYTYRQCDSASFVEHCSNFNQIITRCKDGFTYPVSCEEQLSGSQCQLLDGTVQCVRKESETCDGNYVPSCTGNAKKRCIDSFVSVVPCAPGFVCEGAECKPTASECDADFINGCNGNSKTSCVSGVISEVDCGDNICSGGECVKKEVEACTGSDYPRCGNSKILLECIDGNVVESRCKDGELCSSRSGSAGCTCDEATGLCGNKEPTEGNECNADSYKGSCQAGNKSSQCIDGKITAVDCSLQ